MWTVPDKERANSENLFLGSRKKKKNDFYLNLKVCDSLASGDKNEQRQA